MPARKLPYQLEISRSLRADCSTMARVTSDTTCKRQMPMAAITIDSSMMTAKPKARRLPIFILPIAFIFPPESILRTATRQSKSVAWRKIEASATDEKPTVLARHDVAQTHHRHARAELTQRRHDDDAVVIRRDELALAFASDDGTRPGDNFHPPVVIGEFEIEGRRHHRLSDPEEALLHRPACQHEGTQRTRLHHAGGDQEATGGVHRDILAACREVLTGFYQQGILRAGGVAETGIVAHALAVGMTGVDDHVLRGADLGGKADAFFQRPADNQRRRFFMHGVQVEQVIDSIDDGAQLACTAQFDTVFRAVEAR